MSDVEDVLIWLTRAMLLRENILQSCMAGPNAIYRYKTGCTLLLYNIEIIHLQYAVVCDKAVLMGSKACKTPLKFLTVKFL